MNMQEVQRDLAELKKGIDLAKTNLAKLDGQESQLLLQLKKSHELSSEKQIQPEIDRLTKEISKEESSIESDYKKLKEVYQW